MKRQIVMAFFSLLAIAPTARAENAGGFDWSAWQRMPVLQDGRIMPLDSYARSQVKIICGDVRPLLGELGAKTNSETEPVSADAIQRLAGEGRPRRYLAAELLYSWTVEAEKWDDVPFLAAADETLRSEVFEVPLRGEDGRRLKYVSPRQIRHCQKFEQITTEIDAILLDAQRKQKRPELSALQEKVKTLAEAFELFLQLSYDPGRPGSFNRSLENEFVRMRDSWDQFVETLTQHPELTEPQENLRSVRRRGEGQAARSGNFSSWRKRPIWRCANSPPNGARPSGKKTGRQPSRPRPPICGS